MQGSGVRETVHDEPDHPRAATPLGKFELTTKYV